MSRLWKSGPKDIVRRCRICGCRSDEVRFMVMKDSKTGRLYVHNICHPCRLDENRETRARRLAKDPKYDVRKAMAWNKANRERYNRRRRERLMIRRGNDYRYVMTKHAVKIRRWI